MKSSKKAKTTVKPIKYYFYPVKQIKELQKQLNELNKTLTDFSGKSGKYTIHNHCKLCGVVNPKFGYYPLFSSCYIDGHVETSSMMCNECGRTDEDFLVTFGVPKTGHK